MLDLFADHVTWGKYNKMAALCLLIICKYLAKTCFNTSITGKKGCSKMNHMLLFSKKYFLIHKYCAKYKKTTNLVIAIYKIKSESWT